MRREPATQCHQHNKQNQQTNCPKSFILSLGIMISLAFNIFLIITLPTSLQLILLDISDIFMVFILPVKVSFLICPLCSLYHGECSAVGPGALKPSVGDGIESRRPWFCSPVSLYSFLCCLSSLHLYWCVHQSIIITIIIISGTA